MLQAALALMMLLSAMLSGGATLRALADEKHSILEDLALSVDGRAAGNVRAIHYAYAYNRYVSLRDVAYALIGTPKHFELSVSDTEVVLTTGQDYVPVSGEGAEWPSPAVAEDGTAEPYVYTTRTLRLNPMRVDGRKVKYYSFLGNNAEGRPDCYMSVTDLAMLLDVAMEIDAQGLHIDTAARYAADLATLEEEGFFYEVHSALVGDATTGEVYAAWEPDLSVPIASTTKLMTYLVVMDAVTDGQISMQDAVVIPPEAEALSKTQDGVIAMQAGQSATMQDLLTGMLLPSSNECALSLAIHVAGSEAAFVQRMRQKAAVLGLSDAVTFYNCHGLPVYTDSLAASKVQNHMSARDMFTLCAHILRVYPEITQITSQQSVRLESFATTVDNTNPLLYNVEGVVGLKTGTTNMSGACLVSALQAASPDGSAHTIVAVEFGAEDGTVRCTLSEELIRYGAQQLQEGASVGAGDQDRSMPRSAEELIRLVLRSM